MAAKEKKADISNPHKVEYTDATGQEISATFPTEEASRVLRKHLTADNVHHVYSGPKAEPEAE